jgi:hypothetical protein
MYSDQVRTSATCHIDPDPGIYDDCHSATLFCQRIHRSFQGSGRFSYLPRAAYTARTKVAFAPLRIYDLIYWLFSAFLKARSFSRL